MSYAQLSPAMQKAVFDLGWRSLWPVQEEAIAAITSGTGHVLISGDTASGKTEAAFLPIFSLPLPPSGFAVVYVSPLRALLNDQAERLRRLGRYADIPVHLWHGDVPRTAKRRAQGTPQGVLLTTPESLEAMCVHRAPHLPLLFGDLRFIVVDELHSFLGTGRGLQLALLLRRITRYSQAAPRRVGLSATIGDPERARAFLGSPCNVCTGAGPAKRTLLNLRYDPDGAIVPDLLALTRNRKALIFCNARASVERLTAELNGRCAAGARYLPHHGSLDRRERALAEIGLRQQGAGAIICTSTLELGIDVGAVDLVIQVDCTHSVVALRQRLGRSGRAPGQDRVGQLYASREAELVQSIAVVELLRRGWVEAPPDLGPAFDVLWQQTLSQAIERGGLDAQALEALPPELVAHMLAQDHLARSGDRLVAGVRGEALAHRRDFCAVFQGEDTYLVVSGARQLGQLPPLALYQEGTQLIFAGQRWIIAAVDHERRRFELMPAKGGHPPVFTARPLRVAGGVRQAMVDVLVADTPYPYLDAKGQAVLQGLRRGYRRLGLGRDERPVVVLPGHTSFHAFASDTVANTLALLLQRQSGLTWTATEWGGVEAVEAWPPLLGVLEDWGRRPPPAAELEAHLMARIPDQALVLPKFARHLPPPLRRALHAASELDVAGTLALLRDQRPTQADLGPGTDP